ncbi:hypothetical protein [Bradyrhizobium sp. USDA 4353]
MVRSNDGVTWEILNKGCVELVDTPWADKPEFCPTLSQVTEPEVALPGVTNRSAVLAEIERRKVVELP